LRWLRLFGTRFGSLPIAGIGFAPLLDPLDVFGVPEVISIGWLLEPAPLTGGLAGAAAIRRRTIELAIGIVAVRREEDVTAAALASVVLGTHRAPNRKKIQPSVQIQTTACGRTKTKKEEKIWLRKREENYPEEHGFSNRQFSTTIIPPLTIAISTFVAHGESLSAKCEPAEILELP
jgi:hypothetical protein